MMIMKKKICVSVAVFALAFSAITSFSSVVYAKNNDPALARLEQYAAAINEQSKRSIGYPVNHNICLDGFYEWYTKNHLDKLMINNAGDPMKSSALLNSATFEREVLEHFAPKYGFDKETFWGILSFSGTDGNDHGIYFGRNYLETTTNMKPIVYVSKEAHYSNMRLCHLQNLEVRLIDADEHGRMIPEAFEKALEPSRPALVVYAMGTTFKGGVDDQAALNAILEKKKPVAVYRHVDAALFGGYLPFTEMKDMVNRNVNYFDSIAVSGHKFFGMDEPAGLFLTTKEVLSKQRSFAAEYLSLNGDMPMINCSRSGITPLKFWWLINHDGDKHWTNDAKNMLETAKWFDAQLKAFNYPSFIEPNSNTIYFKRPPEEIMTKYGLAGGSDERLGGKLAHLIVMQHVDKKKLQSFIDDLKASLKKE